MARKKVCNSCGSKNPTNASACNECESEKFAPGWVRELHRINRQFSVEITETNPEYGEIRPRVTLSKWWPGDSVSCHINKPEEWVEIRDVIDHEYAPILDWDLASVATPEPLSAFSPKKSQTTGVDRGARLPEELVGRMDDLVTLAEAIDLSDIGPSDIPEVSRALEQMSGILTSADQTLLRASSSLIERLPEEKSEAIDELSGLLHHWSLRQVTAVSSEVKRRLDLIEFFEDRVLDDETYEIRGEDSIHRILESAMWLIDERYWLLQSNRTLRKLVGDELSERDAEEYGALRPDFACGTVGNKLVLVEIKRPSHTLQVDDLNQLETYVAIAEDYGTFGTFEAFLVGNKVSDDLKKRLKYRGSKFKVRTYSDLIQDARNRYSDYFEGVGEG